MMGLRSPEKISGFFIVLISSHGKNLKTLHLSLLPHANSFVIGPAERISAKQRYLKQRQYPDDQAWHRCWIPDGPETQFQPARPGSHPARVVTVCNKHFFVKGRKVVSSILRCFRTQLWTSLRCTRPWCGSVDGEGGKGPMRTCMKFLS